MLTLAGLRRVQYVFVYPETGDLVLAGPAGDWRLNQDGRILAADTGQPVVRLDDLLVVFRRGLTNPESFFGCSINPRQEAMAKTQAFLDKSSTQPLQPGQRGKWLDTLRDTLGQQDIEIFGVDPASRVAGVLVEADYHMKLIGMGLVDGVDGVKSYLDSITVKNGEAPPAMSVLRWWFALNYDAVRSTPSGDAFELVGQGVRVLSENELLAEQGKRVHTGQSDPLNRQFAESFTAAFRCTGGKVPGLRRTAKRIRSVDGRGIDSVRGPHRAQPSGQPSLLSNAERLAVPKQAVPRQVETVINHRVINRRHVVAGVSGGVMVAPRRRPQSRAHSRGRGQAVRKSPPGEGRRSRRLVVGRGQIVRRLPAHAGVFHQPPNHLARVAGFSEQVHLSLRGARQVGHGHAVLQIMPASQLGRGRFQFVDQVLDHFGDGSAAIGVRIDEPGLIAKPRRPPLVLLHHHRMAVVLIRAVVDFVGERLHQALHERGDRQRVAQDCPACRTRGLPPCQSCDAAAHPTRSRESC